IVEQVPSVGEKAEPAFDVGKRPGGNSIARLFAQLLHAGIARARCGRPPARRRCISIVRRWAGLAPEYSVDEIIVRIGPVTVLIAVRPERVVEDVGIGVRPEHRTEPGDEAGAVPAPPSITRRHIPETAPRVAGLLRKTRREAPLPCGIGRQPCGAITPVRAQRLRVGQGIGLNKLLPPEGALLARV